MFSTTRGIPKTTLLLLLLHALVAFANACELVGRWTYRPPTAFDHKTVPPWSNQVCLYEWTSKPMRADPSVLVFSSPEGCLNDAWKKTPARVLYSSKNGTLSLTFVLDPPEHKTVVVHGAVDDECTFVDMENGGLYTKASVHPFFMPPHEWIRTTAGWLIRAAQITFGDGTRHLTPGYPTLYNGQWMRDGFYGISGLWSLASAKMRKEFAASADWMFSRARYDGIMPQYCPPSGPCQYGQLCNDTVGAPDWEHCQDLDSAAFAVKLAHQIWFQTTAPSAQRILFAKWARALERGMNATTSDPSGSGLLWSNTSRPMVGYGFQDTIQKSGVVLYSSVLQWNASRLLGEMAEASGDKELARRMAILSDRIRVSANRMLWNVERGVFMASAGGTEEDRVDVWGNAMAGAIGFASKAQSQSIFNFFKANERNIFFEGQVRETPSPDHWDLVGYWGNTRPGNQKVAQATVVEYQNGGYWATPLHHVLPFLAMHDRGMACRLLNETIASFRSHGINEWVGPFYPASISGAPGYIASAAGAFRASELLRCWH